MDKTFLSFRIIGDYLLDLVFPKYCLGCKQEGCWLCPRCLEKIKINEIHICPICKKSGETAAVCHECRDASNLGGLWVLTDYGNHLVQDVIKAIKYDYIHELTREFGRLANKYFSAFPLDNENVCLLPVPLHRRRELERGFNQSETIAQAVGEALNLPLSQPWLIRKKYSKAQAKLSREARMNNMKDVFIFNNKISEADRQKKIILVDDVYTTGATMQECAKVLKANGFSNIWGLVIARGK